MTDEQRKEYIDNLLSYLQDKSEELLKEFDKKDNEVKCRAKTLDFIKEMKGLIPARNMRFQHILENSTISQELRNRILELTPKEVMIDCILDLREKGKI